MNAKQPSLYLLGDSICYGQLVSSHLTWVAQMAGALNALPPYDEQPLLLQNASINGNTTRQALERMAYDITSHEPDFLMVQFGMNDCNYWETDKGVPRVSKKAFAANLEEIVDRALAAKARHIFLSTNHPSLKGKFPHMPSFSHSQSNAEYNEIIRLTEAGLREDGKPVELIDMEAAWLKEVAENGDLSLEKLLLPDGIHLSLEGHKLYAKVVIPRVTASLIKDVK